MHVFKGLLPPEWLSQDSPTMGVSSWLAPTEGLGGVSRFPQVPGGLEHLCCLPYPLVSLGSSEIGVTNVLKT